jgi:hypothetical protein
MPRRIFYIAELGEYPWGMWPGTKPPLARTSTGSAVVAYSMRTGELLSRQWRRADPNARPGGLHHSRPQRHVCVDSRGVIYVAVSHVVRDRRFQAIERVGAADLSCVREVLKERK